MKKLLPYITIIGISAFVGNMLNIGLSYAIHWQSLPPAGFMESFKVDFPLLLAPTALTLMPAWLGSLALFLRTPKNSDAKKLWMYAFAGLSITIVQTSIYHLPMNLDFMDLKYDDATAASKLQGWVISHWVRVVIAIISGVYAISAFKQASISDNG